ncbi:MAG: filamentous hemagglutinin N-terminal domain-containing protein [Phycisphaerales bacterium]|nr:filamentous hemagglutinin N-terminal domain-containing protein [Phycisphaerales bacterium]
MRQHRASLAIARGPLAALAAAMFTCAVTATPENGVFIHGVGTITYGSDTWIDLFGDQFIIGWDDFDLAAGESVTFNGTDFTVLNTINTGAPSNSWIIDGAINAPGGEVWFVNPAGVLFGQNSVIDVGGIIAAAGSIDNDAFLSGNHEFTLTGDVFFGGTMASSIGMADRAVFLGQHVTNTGLVSANIIAMASGSTIRLIDLETRISLEVDTTALDSATPNEASIASMQGQAFVTNHGRLETGQGGQVLLASGDMLGAMLPWDGLAIEHDGEIHSAGGDVDIIALDGAIRTDQYVAGGNAHVAHAGLIDVSSNDGGGDVTITGPSVVVGSDLHAQGGWSGGGGDIALRGYHTVMLAGDELVGWNDEAAGHTGAAGLSVGAGHGDHDGGSIFIEATDGTVVGASTAAVTALGGLSGGNGGTVEVIGQGLQYNSRTRTDAVNGQAGELLLETAGDLRITADGSVGDANFTDLTAAPSGDNFIGAQLTQTLGLLDGNLDVWADGDLTFETSIGALPVAGGSSRLFEDASFTAGTITFADPSGTTALWAGGELNLYGNVHMDNTSLELVAGQRDGVSGLAIDGDVTAGGAWRGDLTIDARGLLDITGDLGTVGAEIGSLQLQSVGSMRLSAGDRAIRALRDVTLGSLDGADLFVTMDGDLLVEAGADITFGEGLQVDGIASLSATAGGTLSNKAIMHVDGDLSFTGGTIDNDLALTAEGDLALAATDGVLWSDDALQAGGDISLSGTQGVVSGVSMTTTSGDITMHSDNGAVVVQGDVQSSGVVTIAAAQDINIEASITAEGTRGDGAAVQLHADDDLRIFDAVTGQSVDIAAGGTLALDGATITATQQLAPGTDALTIAAPDMIVMSTSTLHSAGQLTVHGNAVDGSLTLADMQLHDGDLSITAQQGDLRLLATVDGGHDLTLQAQAGTLYFAGDLGGDAALASLTADAASGIRIGGDVAGTNFDVTHVRTSGHMAMQNATAVSSDPMVASISGFSDTLTLDAGGDLIIGAGHGMAQLGDLSLTAGGSMQVTDITTAGDVTLTADQLHVWDRMPVDVVLADGTVTASSQTSIVAGGDLVVQADSLTYDSTAGDDPLFGALGSVAGVPDDMIGNSPDFTMLDLQRIGADGVTDLLMRWLNQPADDPTLIAAESQSADADPDIDLTAGNDDPLTEQVLSDLGIQMTAMDDTRTDAHRRSRPGEITVDLVQGPGPAQVGRVIVTRHRLHRSEVAKAVGQWSSTWADDARATITSMSDPDAELLDRIHAGLDSTWAHLERAGLTPSEVQASRTFVANALLGEGASATTVATITAN